MATAEGELSDATINSYRYTMKRLDAVLADRMLNSVIAEDLEAALRTQGGTSYAMHRRNARAFGAGARRLLGAGVRSRSLKRWATPGNPSGAKSTS